MNLTYTLCETIREFSDHIEETYPEVFNSMTEEARDKMRDALTELMLEVELDTDTGEVTVLRAG